MPLTNRNGGLSVSGRSFCYASWNRSTTGLTGASVDPLRVPPLEEGPGAFTEVWMGPVRATQRPAVLVRLGVARLQRVPDALHGERNRTWRVSGNRCSHLLDGDRQFVRRHHLV